MSLHIGGKTEIAEKKILFILDYEQAKNNPDTCLFLEKSGNKEYDNGSTKSIVVTENGGKVEIFCSPISSVTLAGRCKYDWSE